MKVVVIDYGMGNLRSVYNTVFRLGYSVKVSSEICDINNADKIILPGVGHFNNGMKNLTRFNLLDTIKENVITKQKPILGICLGMQMLADFSEEGNQKGFGWIDSEVISFNRINHLKVPHMGWNTLDFGHKSPLFNGINNQDEFYFAHTFHFNKTNKNQILATSNYIYDFTSAVTKENIVGFQFHPEKSHESGRILLKNFLDYHYV